jgi:excisionase family DNA binding protein
MAHEAPTPLLGELSTPAAAEILGVHSNTLLRWVAEGKVRAIRSAGGGVYRFRRADLEEFARSQMTLPEREPQP